MIRSMAEQRALESAWAAHLETCMDPECTTCATFDARIYGGAR